MRRPAYSIGFTRHSARDFFETLERAGVELLIDVRLRNTSQLAGFTKRDDLAYLLDRLGGIEYLHQPLLAPSPELFADYRKRRIDWTAYARRFGELLRERRVDEQLDRALFDRASVLLCSEPSAERCHRRLVLEYLERSWGDLELRHL